MLLLSCCNILVIILTISPDIQATRWNATVCLTYAWVQSLRITLNKDNYKDLSYQSHQKCFYTKFELNDGEKPSTIKVNPYHQYKAFVQNQDLQQMYAVVCYSYCGRDKKLEKLAHWNIEVIRSEINGNYKYSFEIKPYSSKYIKFKTNSRTSNKSFFLPMNMNSKSRIELLTKGKFWLDTIIKLKNMETSKIYSCIFVLNHTTQSPYHECSLTNGKLIKDSMWKIELTSQSKLIRNIEEIKILFAVTGSETNSSQSLTFKKLAYLPTFYAFTNIGNISISEAEISFEDSNTYFDIFKIVMTRILTGEEYGCVNLHKTNLPKYSCKLLKGKNWLLNIVSPEEHERNFTIEIIQDKISSFSRNLKWMHFSVYGDSYIKYFNLKTYEEDEITSLKLHFFDKSLKINEISLINNYTEYKFKTNGESKIQNNSVMEFILITKEKGEKGEKIHSNESCPVMKIVIGLLAVIILFLIIIFTTFIVRDKMSRNKNVSKDNTSTLQVIGEDNNHFSMRNTNSVAISEPRLEFCSLHQDSLDLYENIDSKSGITPALITDCDLYAQPEPRRPPKPAQPVDDSDIEQLYTQPIKYICR